MLPLLARRRPRQRYRQRAESCAWKTPKHSQNDTRGTTQHTGFGARPKWFSVLRCLFAPNMLGHGSCVAARHRGIATWPPRVRRAVRRGRRNVAPSWATPPSSLPRTRGQPPPPGYRPGATTSLRRGFLDFGIPCFRLAPVTPISSLTSIGAILKFVDIRR